jgi:hypothetical protein
MSMRASVSFVGACRPCSSASECSAGMKCESLISSDDFASLMQGMKMWDVDTDVSACGGVAGVEAKVFAAMCRPRCVELRRV